MTKHNSESGRTMLEMLGVLAIMGVIMYGAIAGIGFGVNMYKINATFNEAEELSQGIIDLYSWRQGYPTADNIVKAVIANDVLSGAQQTDSSSLNAPFGEFIIAAADETVDANHFKKFGIQINGLPPIACSRLQVMSFANMNVVQYGENSGVDNCETDCQGNPGTVCLVLR